MTNEIYMENIMDHYKNPRNFGSLESPTVKHIEYNPLCGDKIEMSLLIENGKIKDIKFKGNGCSISQASTSMLLEMSNGKSIDEIKNLTKEDVFEMLSINLSPVRMKCALLGLDTLKNAILIHEKYGEKNE
nr:SUF system NifU family Fe-S cluster assembly protein [Candidatus Woesearchaeota archaeon]